MDIVDKKTRSRMMAGIRGKDTRPELRLRKQLFAEGLRYQLHRRDLPGRPDLVFPKYRAVVFVHGCFWHRHGCKYTTTPKSNVHFWMEKFAANGMRDDRDQALLKSAGWRIATVWECALGQKALSEEDLQQLLEWITQGGDGLRTIRIPKRIPRAY